MSGACRCPEPDLADCAANAARSGPAAALPLLHSAHSQFHAHHPMAQYVFTMNRVGKIVPPKRQILKDISLSFFPGAKIA